MILQFQKSILHFLLESFERIFGLTDDERNALNALDLLLRVQVFLLQVALLVLDVFLLKKQYASHC
jgi:hypothetical protein